MKSIAFLASVLLLACVQGSVAQLENNWYSACTSESGSYTLTAGYDPTCAAWGYFTDAIDTTGWSYLQIETNPALAGNIQAYAGGWLEGALPGYALRLQESYVNTWASTFTNSTCPQKAYDWVNKQVAWVEEQYKANPNNYWTQVMNVYTQVNGIYDGYMTQATPSPPMTRADMLMLNLQAEVGDILLADDLELRKEKDVLKMHDLKKVKATMMQNSHCSALVRLSPDGQDIFSAHTTWTSYCTMLRVYKYYNMPLGTSANAVQFSSYPGVVHSIDDYYQTSANMVVIETTNNVANMTLYDYVVYSTVPTFVRVVVSNRLATNGKDWAEMYAENNSGTYNNQWMVVDNKMFTPGVGAAAGTLYIASQIPGQVEIADTTNVLKEQGYWSSYNIPYFPDLWTKLGYGELVQQYGAMGVYLWDYKNSFRALIFDRDAPKVATLDDMRTIMQENNWQTDPLSKNSSELAICSRMDLANGPLSTAGPSGAIDAKISSFQMMSDGLMSVVIKSGPTVETQVPFRWSTSPWATNTPHLGLPDLFDFDWQTFEIQAPPSNSTLKPRIILTEQ